MHHQNEMIITDSYDAPCSNNNIIFYRNLGCPIGSKQTVRTTH